MCLGGRRRNIAWRLILVNAVIKSSCLFLLPVLQPAAFPEFPGSDDKQAEAAPGAHGPREIRRLAEHRRNTGWHVSSPRRPGGPHPTADWEHPSVVVPIVLVVWAPGCSISAEAR